MVKKRFIVIAITAVFFISIVAALAGSASGKVLRGGPVALVDGNERIRYINKSAPGERIEIASYIVKGKTNLFVFYSDY